MKISFITTIFNEEKTIDAFLNSLLSQTQPPDEIIIVDGGSTDKTIERIKKKKINVKLVIKKGNRSVGRNEAIKRATGDIIVCSDSGNILDKNWIKEITKPFRDKAVDVVAGYYEGRSQNNFQKCLIPYVLVMPDQVNPKEFLPATRSIAFTKKIWKIVGGFNEHLSHNEDYAFAHQLKEKGAKIVFARDAIVYWIPRNNFKEAFVMFFRFALGDAESGIFRSKVLFLFTRYFFVLYLCLLTILYRSSVSATLIIVLFFLYILWSISKNYRYVKNNKAFFFLPLLQFTADIAVLSGTTIGIVRKIKQFNYRIFLKQNRFLFGILFVYLVICLSTIRWGIPNQNHPFPYHMDEWHQLQAVANTFRYGTPNTEGSANGTLFHFLFSGFYLVPFMLLKIIDPFALQIDNSFMRERVFEILRFQTILFGMLSIVTLYKIAELLKTSRKLTVFLFTFTPIWLMLSGYFKYDIALMFWILLSLFCYLRFAKDPTNKNFIIAAIPSSLAIAVKVSAVPLVLLYFLLYFLFTPSWKNNLKSLMLGFVVLIVGVLLFGMPDTLFGKGNILNYLFENIINNPSTTSNYYLAGDLYRYLFMTHFPLMFGHGLVILFIPSLIFWVTQMFKHGIKHYKVELFLIIAFVLFLMSDLKLQIGAFGNRSLVLLPFLVLITSFAVQRVLALKKWRIILISIGILCTIQLVESIAWIETKQTITPQQTSSAWIKKHIASRQVIGIENIPIYQYLPDLVQKEFYFNEYKVAHNQNNYRYQLVESSSKKLPSVIIITNDEMEESLLKKSPKKELLARLQKEGYQKKKVFRPDLTYYRLFGDDKDLYLSGIVTVPLTISIYTISN